MVIAEKYTESVKLACMILPERYYPLEARRVHSSSSGHLLLTDSHILKSYHIESISLYSDGKARNKGRLRMSSLFQPVWCDIS